MRVPQAIKEWTANDHKLLSRFYECNVFNAFDLQNKILINQFETVLKSSKDSQIYHKFSSFKQTLNKDKEIKNTLHRSLSLKQNVIQNCKVTRNAKYLQQYILTYNTRTQSQHSRAEHKAYDLATNEDNDSDANEETTTHSELNTLIITYNPLQTVIIRSNIFQDVTHCIHLYRMAYDSEFIPNTMLPLLSTEWMETFNVFEYESEHFNGDSPERYTTIINALSTLLRFNKKYDIILVPASVILLPSFVDKECEIIPPHYEAVQQWRISFLYKGNLYRFDETKHRERFEEKLNDCDRIPFIDDVKLVLSHLHNNISTANNDGIIKRLANDEIFRWLNIGCGACFLQESNGKSAEIAPVSNLNHFQSDFPKALQKAMFLNYIDCRLPYNGQIITENQKCAICRDLQILPSSIGNSACQHTFCKRCIEQWNEMRKFKIGNEDDGNNGNEDSDFPKCPLCKRRINEICRDLNKEMEMKKDIPITVYEQILNENEGRYLRLHAIDHYYYQKQQRVLYDENKRNEPLMDMFRNDTEMEFTAAGYNIKHSS